MTKHYFAEDGKLKKMRWFRFKHPVISDVTDHIAPKNLDTTEVEPRTAEQIDDSAQRSLARTRREMNDIAECNSFDKFATFTFDPKKHNAYDRDYCKKKMILWLNNQQKLHGSFRYLMVTEPMKDGKIHFHALLGGFTGKYHATNTRGKGDKARQCYKIDSWENSNGFADMEDISNTQALVNYIVKYISKEISNPLMVKNAKRYYASRSLKRPTKTYNDTLESLLSVPGTDPNSITSFENDHVAIYTLPLA